MAEDEVRAQQAAAMPFLAIDNAQMLKEQAKVFDAKKSVWIATAVTDQAGYIAAEVKSAEGDDVEVETERGELKKLKKDDCDAMNPPKYEKCVDMANLTYLNEASVLHNLSARYKAGLIYTYSGLFCIAVNPYRRLPIYNDGVIKMYRGKRRPEMPPHVFSIVDNAYQDMLIEHDNQSMLITGESGAGKTENTKKVIQYIAKVAGAEKKAPGKDEPSPSGVARIKGDLDEQVVEANPLLEAFGNAKTTRNNNSSRFGKFIRCHFGQTGKLAGADIESYLLEKNRVIHQGAAERNYHIFYQILYAVTDEELAALCLPTREAQSYGFLAKGVYHVDRMDDNEEYGLTVNAISVLGFTEVEKMSMFKIVSSILNFSMMKFKQKPRDEQAEVDDPSDGERVAYLIGLPVKEFLNSLIKPKVKVGTEYVNKGQSVSQVLYAVSALSKALFERMFWWIVARVNKALDTKEKRSYFIGVLDIAGFEIFDYNSFEQICINLTNEKLQQFFNHHMFVLEQEEYKKEGIHWEFIDFGMDLEETINLIEKPMGIFAMLEEECIVPKATDQTYLTKLHKQHEKSKAYTKPTPKQNKQGMGDFILHHYAGSVGYSVANWLEKNKDPINEHTAQLFSKATDALVSHLFQDYNPDKATKRKGSAFQTVSYRHKEQLKNLLDTLMSTSPHFVRCIIPNENKAPGEIDGQLCLHQLRCNGVLEGIRICRKGFPSRMLFSDFRQRYQILAASAIPTGFIDGKVAAEKLVEALQLDENEFRIGLTKVFFRSGIVGELEEMRDERLSRIISQFQAYCKAHLMRIEYKKMHDRKVALAVIQRNVRKFLMLRNWTWWKLYIKVQPMLSVARAEDEMQAKEEELKKAMEDAVANESRRKDLEEKMTDVLAEKDQLFIDLQSQTEQLIEAEDRLVNLQSEKDKLEQNYAEAVEKLEGEEHATSRLNDKVTSAAKDIDALTTKQGELTEEISKLQGLKTSQGKEIDTLKEDLAREEEAFSKLGRDKKGVEEQLEDRSQQLASTESKLSNMNKLKNKLEASLKETEFNLSKEKDAKAKIDKEKRRLDGELKETKDLLAESESELKSAKDTILKRDKAIKEFEEAKETNENLIKQLQKKIAELLTRVEELEEELENERKLRQKVELARKELEIQLEESNEQLEVQGGATSAQMEVSKKKDAECARLRKEIEELNVANDAALAAAKVKFNAALAEAQTEADNLNKARAKAEKEKSAAASELADVSSELDTSKKKKAAADKANRGLEETIAGLRNQVEAAEQGTVDAVAVAVKNAAEGSGSEKALAEADEKVAAANKVVKGIEAQLLEAKLLAEDEAKGKKDAGNKLKNALAEIDSLNEQIEEEQSSNLELKSKISRLNGDLQSIKGKVDEEGAAKLEALEEGKKKLVAQMLELEENLAIAEAKASSMEKQKSRLSDEVEDVMLDLEKTQTHANSLEKKQKKVDQEIEEWRLKCNKIQGELDNALKDGRTASAEIVKLRTAGEAGEEKYEALRKEHKALFSELAALKDQLGEGVDGAEIEKMRRQLGVENEELKSLLEETEAALQIEEGKLVKVQLEFAQHKQTSEAKIKALDAESDSSRKNHQRQLDSLQEVVNNEVNAKGELQKSRKVLESTISEMESQVDSANRSCGEYSKTVKKLQAQIKEMQLMLDNESRERDECRDQTLKAERRANELAVQLDETRVSMEQLMRAKKKSDAEKDDHKDRVAELQALYNNAASGKRKAEADFHRLQKEIEDLENDAKSGDELAVKAAAEIAKVVGDLKAAQDATANSEKSRAILAKQAAELQEQLEEAENSGANAIKVQCRKLEARILDLESDLDTEARVSAEAAKATRKADKKVNEIQFQLADEQQTSARHAECADKLSAKVKDQRMEIELLEAKVGQLSSKYKKAAAELKEADERCDTAEKSLLKARQKARSSAATRTASRAPSPPAAD